METKLLHAVWTSNSENMDYRIEFVAKKGNSPRLKYQPVLWTAIEAGGWEVGEVKNSKSPPNTSALYLPVSLQNTRTTIVNQNRQET